MANEPEGPGIIAGSVAQNLLMMQPADLLKLQRGGWVSPVGRDRWKLVDVVQGAIKQLRAAQDEISAEALAQMLDLTTSRLAILANEGNIPKNSRGRYPMPASVQAYVRYLRSAAGDGGERTLSKQRARLTKEKADVAEIEASRIRGELIPKGQMIAANTALFNVVRTRVLAIGPKLAPQLVLRKRATEIEAAITREAKDALTALAQMDIAPAKRSQSSRRGRGRPSKLDSIIAAT